MPNKRGALYTKPATPCNKKNKLNVLSYGKTGSKNVQLVCGIATKQVE